ncbi:MAG: hypothetical protein AUJ98_06800 [Bacteroidetes bacterium CG2_30_33_31]|nr:MAG: hypothetical protein AUJ98_06800 [Bacteroidetes bacterium CG2_30_33_31]
MEKAEEKHCVFCNKTDNEVPLVQLSYSKGIYWICPQHIPILIHEPQKLQGLLPGADNMQAG